jgi:hypothetical protein
MNPRDGPIQKPCFRESTDKEFFMLRVDHIFQHGAIRVRACGAAAALTAAGFFGMSAMAQSPAPTPAAVTQSAKNAKPAKKAFVSPYARAAARRAPASRSVAHAPTMIQAMGKPHKPHANGSAK